MPASLMRKLFSGDTPGGNLRRIDDHYHLEMIAENSRQLVEHQSRVFHMQREAAVATLRGLAEIANRQGQANSLLMSLVEGVGDLNNSLEVQTEVLRRGFEESAQLLLQQQSTLQQIADVLRRHYETQALELLREADQALKTGMKSVGRDREEEFADASRLLREVLANPIGSRNYVAWFQMGWLKWKYERNISEAEEAFYHASRLSASKADSYHTKGLSHLAYMQYFEAKYSDAYATINQALKLSPDDHDIRYDAARYAALHGREAEALALLEKCIEQEPQTFILMFAERDFSGIAEGLVAFGARKTEERRNEALEDIGKWRQAVEITLEAQARAECQIDLPAELAGSIAEAAEGARGADYVTAVGLVRKAAARRLEVIKIVRERLEAECRTRAAEKKHETDALKQIDAQKDVEMARIKQEYEAVASNKPEYNFASGCLYAIGASVIGIVLLVATYEVDPVPPFVSFLRHSLGGIAVLLTLFGGLIQYLIDIALWTNEKRAKEQERDNKIRQLKRKTSRQLPPLEERLRLAERQNEKAWGALGFFTEQTRTLV